MFGQRKPPGMGPPPDIRGNPQGPPGYVAQASRPEGVGGVVQSSTHTGMPTRPRFNPNAGQGVSRRPNPTVPRTGFKGGNPGQQQAQGGPPQQPVQPGPPIDFFNAVGGTGSAYAGGVGNAGTMNRGWQMASARNKGNGYGTT
jgi:hypothetical protein